MNLTDPRLMAEIFKVMPELAGTGFLEAANQSVQRFMGAEQGDSTGDEGTSSDSDEDTSAERGSVNGFVARALQGRIKALCLTNLKQLCMAIIIKNITKLEASKRQKIIFQNIGEKFPEVLNLILAELRPKNQVPVYAVMDIYVRVGMEFGGMLLHKKLEEINLDILDEKKCDVSKMWPILIKRCPNLKIIACDRYAVSSKDSRNIPIRQLVLFKKLVAIIMPNYLCDDSAMETIASNFPKLKHLDVTLNRLSAKGLTHLFKLKHLEKFVYSIKSGIKTKNESVEKYNSTLITKCLENMPNLKQCISKRNEDELHMSGGLANYYKKHSSDNKTLKLEKLFLNKSLGIPPERLPDVKEVKIIGPITCAKELAKFKNLQKLDMSVISSENAMIILEEIGKKLKHLRIENEYMQGMRGTGLESSETVFDFYRIFHCCPNLEFFEFGGMKFTEDTSISLSAANFRKLRSVDINMYDMQGYQMPIAIVEHILRAEKLEYLQLYWTRCLPKALYNVLNENNPKHFKNLKFLILKRMWVKNYKGYIKSLKTLITRAPLLNRLGIDCCEQGVEDFKKSGLSQLLEQIPGFEYKTDFKDGYYCF